MNDQLLTLSEVARALHVGRSTLYRNLEEWGIPLVRLPNDAPRVRASALEAWIDGQTQAA